MAEFKLGRIKFVYQGTWTQNHSYSVDDVVTNGGKTYICVISHTSTNATSGFATDSTGGLGITKWNLIADGTTWRNTWTATTYYNLGDIVVWGATVYVCKTAHTSQTYLEDDQSKWDQFSAGFKWLGAWTTSTRYKVRDLVYYGGSTYVCNTQHNSASTASSGLENDQSKWDIFNQGITYLGDWSGSSVRYKQNDVVKFGADLWICTAYHTSTGTTIDTGNFSIFVNGFQFENSWSASNEYQVGDVVTYGGYTYTAVQNNGSASPQTPSTATAYWKVFTSGLVYSGEWNTGTAYKIGQVVTLGGYTYVAKADNSASQPPSSNWGQLSSGIRWNAAANTTYTNVASSNISATGSGSPTFTVTRTGTAYSVVIGSTAGTGYTVNDTLKVLGSALGGASPGNDLVVKVATITGGSGTGPIATVSIVSGFAATWKTGITYVAGDAVFYGNSSYICISAHIGSTGVNDPISDSTATYWNILSNGADTGALTTQGDMVYYGTNGPVRLPIGTDGQILRVNKDHPEWQYYGQLQNVVYVAPTGTDSLGNGQGLTLDKPWLTLLYACRQIEDGYLNTNAGLLLKVNKQFMMKEVNQFILNNYSFNVTGTSSSNNTFVVGGSSTTSQVTTANMYYGMPITFSAATGGVTVGTVYYVNTIPTTTTFTISDAYKSGITKSVGLSSGVASTASFNYTQSKAERDTGTVIDGLIYDLTHGGNLYTETATQAYFNTLTSFTSTGTTQQAPVFAGSLVYLKDTLFPAVMSNSAPANNYQTINGISSGSRAIQNITSVATTSVETGALTTVQGLLSIITSSLTAGTYGNIPQLQRPNTTIYLKTGTYNEYSPIVVPSYTAVVGDELRSTIVQMSGPQINLYNDKTKTVTALKRVQSVLSNLVANTTVTPTTTGTTIPNTQTQVKSLPAGDTGNTSAVNLVVANARTIQDMFAGGGVITGPTNPNFPKGVLHQPAISMPTVTGYNSSYLANYGDGVTLIQANYQFIKDEIVSFLNTDVALTGSAQWSAYGSTYQAETLRDLTYILDAVSYDMTYGCNNQSLIIGSSYYSLNTAQLVAPYLLGVLESLGRLSTILGQIVQKTSVTRSTGNTTTQYTTGTAGSAAAAAFAQARIADITYWINNGTPDTSSATFTGSISTTTLTVSSVSGTIKIGQIVTGGTVAAGTYITAGSGSSWTVSVSQTATATGSTLVITPAVSGSYALATTANKASFDAIQFRASEIANDAQSWVTRFYQNESPILVLTNRDAGYVVNALSYDVLFGTNFNSITCGRAYNRLVTSSINLQTNLADSTYGVLGFIGERVKILAANGAVVQTSTVIDEMIAQIYGQPTSTATFNGTITGTQLVVNGSVTGTIAVGMQLSGTGIANGTSIVSGTGTTWLLNYNQSVSSTTTSIIKVTTSVVLNGSTYNNVITSGTTSGFVPGLTITITGTTIGNLTAGIYYIKQVLSSTQFTISQSYLGSVFAITSTAQGAMTAVVYGIYGGLALTTDITVSGTTIPVSAVATSGNLITVSSNAGMYVDMPITFTGLPANITTTATAITSSAITLSSVVGVAVGQRVWFTGYTPQAAGTASSIVANQRYYVQSIVSSTITIASTFGGSAITLTDATGLTLTATFDAAGGITPGNIYWINSVTAGTYPAAGTTITVTATYKSGTALTITNNVSYTGATCTAGMPLNQGICDKNTNGTIQPWNNPTGSYGSASGYNNTLATIQGAEVIRANKTFLANEMVAYVLSQYTGTVTTTASNGTITCSGAHNLTVGDPVVFSYNVIVPPATAPASFDSSIALGQIYWILTTPSTTTFTLTTTAPGKGIQTTKTLNGATGTMTVSYYMSSTKCIRDAGQYIDALVYDLGLTGNYKSSRAIQTYLSAQAGSTSNDLFHLRNGSGLRNMTTNGLTGAMTLPNALGTKRPTAGSYSSLDAGFGPNDANVWISYRSPYTQNLTLFGSGCSGMKIDAALHSGGNKSIVANDYTTIISDGFGVWCTGSGTLTELVSVFAYYSYAGYMAEYGGRIRATNGNSSYGTYGVIAEGIDSYETPIYGRLNNRANPAYVTGVVTDGVNAIYRLEFENAGSAYTNAIPTINGSGYNIVAIQDEFRDSAVFESRLVDLNNGQGIGGSNYLTASNVAQTGTVGTVTIANSDIQLSSAYIGMRIQLTGGTGVGQYANIIGYSQGSKLANIIRPNFATLTITTNSTTLFTVASTATMYVGQPIYMGAPIGGLSVSGSLPNIVYTPTVYYVSTTSFSSTQFRLSTTYANAIAGTNITLTATSATPAVMASSIIVSTTLTVGTLSSGTIYPGMLLTGGSILPNTYIVANISGSGSGSTWIVSVSQAMASTTLTGTIAVPVYEAGWDHVVPGTTVNPTLDATSAYIIEPAISYTGPGYNKVAITMTAAATTTWAGLAYGQGTFVATSNATGVASTAKTTDGTTWAAGGSLPTDASSKWGNIVYGGGQGATATAVVGGVGGSGAVFQAVLGTGNTAGQIISVTVVNGGYNYTTPPTIVITDSTGTGATATARVLNGQIQAVDMVITGSVYTSPTITAVTSSLSSITAITYGSGYYTAPIVTIAAPFTSTGWSSGGSVTAGNYYSAVDTTVSPNVTNYYLASGSGTTFSSTKPTFTNAVYGKSGYGAPGVYSTGYGTNVTLTYVGSLPVASANTNTNAAGYGVISYTISQAGYGYTSTPTVTVTDANAAFMAISNATSSAAYSTDQGATWTATASTTGKTNLNSLAYGNNLYIAVGGTSSAVAVSYYPGTSSSLTTTTWSDQSSNITTNSSGYSHVAYGAGVFCAIGGTVSSFTAADPTKWYAGGTLPSKTWASLTYGNGRFVALASDGTICYTINWQSNTWTVSPSYTAGSQSWTTAVNNPLYANGVTTWSRIRYGQGLFIAIATSSQAVATSPDGQNWTYYATGMPSSSNWLGLAFGNPQNAALGAVPTWVSVSNTSGKTAARIYTGATPQGRIRIVNSQVSEVRMVDPGSGFPRGLVTATSTTSTGTITLDNITNLTANQPIVFGASSGNIVAGTYYFVKGTPTPTSGLAGTIQISTTSGGSIFALTASTPTSMTYFAGPIITQTDPNKVNTAPLAARIGNGALGNPSFGHRGTANTTGTASYLGDGYADLYQTGQYVNVSGLYQIPKAGCNVVFNSITGTSRWYKLVQVTNILGIPGNYTATFQINPSISTLLAPAHNDLITTNLSYSNVRLTGHDFLYIGTGGFSATNYPYVDATKAVSANQQLFVGGGRVFFTSTDQDGNFNVGNLFGVQQSTGTATLNASAFNLSGLQSLTLGSVSLGVGSATITQFSTDPYFTANSDSVVPTQKAIKSFITAQIGGGQSSLNVNTITSGQIYIAGNTISNTNNAQILVTSKMNFTGGIDGAPVALAYFGQK